MIEEMYVKILKEIYKVSIATTKLHKVSEKIYKSRKGTLFLTVVHGDFRLSF